MTGKVEIIAIISINFYLQSPPMGSKNKILFIEVLVRLSLEAGNWLFCLSTTVQTGYSDFENFQ